MGYELDAFIGPISDLRQWREQIKSAHVFALGHELGLVAMTGDLMSELSARYHDNSGQEVVLGKLWCPEASRGRSVAFVTAFYFGDDGGQEAWVWKNQELILDGVSINQVLRELGIKAEGSDEFDAVGLGRYRKTETWAGLTIIEELTAGREPVGALIEALNFHDGRSVVESVHSIAAIELGEKGIATPEVIEALAQCAKEDTHYGVHLKATGALARLGHEAVPALAGLLAPGVMKDPWAVVFNLGKLGPAAAPAVPRLVELLKIDQDYKVRAECAKTQGSIGEQAREAIPALIAAFDDAQWTVRRSAVGALALLGLNTPGESERVLAVLLKALHDKDDNVRSGVAQALGTVASPTTQVLASLGNALNDEYDMARSVAAESLGKIGKDWPHTIPALVSALRDKSWLVQLAAISALVTLGAHSAEVIAAIEKLSNDKNTLVRTRTNEALKKIRALPRQP